MARHVSNHRNDVASGLQMIAGDAEELGSGTADLG